jgi:hypothetical protein
MTKRKFGHYQDGHFTLLVQFPLPVLQGALLVMEICRFGSQHHDKNVRAQNRTCVYPWSASILLHPPPQPQKKL